MALPRSGFKSRDGMVVSINVIESLIGVHKTTLKRSTNSSPCCLRCVANTRKSEYWQVKRRAPAGRSLRTAGNNSNHTTTN